MPQTHRENATLHSASIVKNGNVWAVVFLCSLHHCLSINMYGAQYCASAAANTGDTELS